MDGVREFRPRSPLENAAELVDSVRISSGEMRRKARMPCVWVLWRGTSVIAVCAPVHGAREEQHAALCAQELARADRRVRLRERLERG